MTSRREDGGADMKPCPECGEAPECVMVSRGNPTAWQVSCPRCGRHTSRAASQEEAEFRWMIGKTHPINPMLRLVMTRASFNVTLEDGRVRLWTVGCLTDLTVTEARELAQTLDAMADAVEGKHEKVRPRTQGGENTPGS